MENNILIVGAGITGATCARLLADLDYNVTVIEKNDAVGGNCHDHLSNDGTCYIHDFGPHIFHTENIDIWNFVNRFSKFTTYVHKVYSKVNGKKYVFPINFNTIAALFKKNVYSKEDVNEIIHDTIYDNPHDFEQAAINDVGSKIYKSFIKNFTEKQWKTDPKNLPIDIYKRISIRYNFVDDYFQNQYQGLPVNGYTEMIKNMLNHKKINLILNTKLEDFDVSEFSKIIYTGGFVGLDYRSTEFIHYTGKPSDISVLNLPQDRTLTRITNFNVLAKIKKNSELNYFCSERPTKNNKCNELYPILTEANILQHKRQQEEFLKKYPNTLFCGRLATYQYLDMDKAIAQAFKLVEDNFIYMENNECQAP